MMSYYDSPRAKAHKEEMAQKKYTVGSSGTSAVAKARDAKRDTVLREMGIQTTSGSAASKKKTGSGYVPTYGPNLLYTSAGNAAPPKTTQPKVQQPTAGTGGGVGQQYGGNPLYDGLHAPSKIGGAGKGSRIISSTFKTAANTASVPVGTLMQTPAASAASNMPDNMKGAAGLQTLRGMAAGAIGKASTGAGAGSTQKNAGSVSQVSAVSPHAVKPAEVESPKGNGIRVLPNGMSVLGVQGTYTSPQFTLNEETQQKLNQAQQKGVPYAQKKLSSEPSPAEISKAENGRKKSEDQILIELREAKEKDVELKQEFERFNKENQIFFQAEGLFGTATDRHIAQLRWQQEAIREEYRDNKDLIAQLEKELSQAEQERWGRLMLNEDFAKYEAIGASVQNPSWEAVNNPANIDPLSSPAEREGQIGNIVTFSKDNKDALEYSTKRDVGNAAYTYMTDEEVQIYNYLLGKHGRKTAQMFLDSLENTLNYRYGAEAAGKYTQIEDPFLRTMASIPYGVAAGVDQFASGITQLFHEDEQPITPMQYASETIQQSLGPVGQVAYGVSNTVGNMLPSMLIGKGAGIIGSTLGLGVKGANVLASASGAASVGASAAGNAYKQALQEGYTSGQAKTYAALVGVSEAGLKFVLNGVGKLQGISEKNLLGKIQTLDSAFAKMALTGVVKIGGEVLEEELQLQLEPLFRTIVFEEAYEAPTGKEMLQTAVIAALSNGVIEGPAIAGVEVDFGKFGEMVRNDLSAQETVADALKNSRPGSTAGELAQSLAEQAASGKQLSNEDIGKLYTIVQVDTQMGKSVRSEGKVTELLQEAMALPADSPAYQTALELTVRLETALTELGLDASELYHMSRADQAKLIEQATNTALSDQNLGELARLVEQDGLTDASEHGKVEEQNAAPSTLTAEQKTMVQELLNSGEKCTPENIVGIGKMSNGKIVWYETGNEHAGLIHTINRHGTQFENKGITNGELPAYIIEAVCSGEIVGHQGKKTPPRTIYEFTYNGVVQRVAVQVGSNGFIVSANPKSMEGIK